jgi:hypothetical protein
MFYLSRTWVIKSGKNALDNNEHGFVVVTGVTNPNTLFPRQNKFIDDHIGIGRPRLRLREHLFAILHKDH